MWKSVNAKIQGTLHKKLDIPCQDYTTSSNKEKFDEQLPYYKG